MWTWLNNSKTGQMVFSWAKVFVATVTFLVLEYVTQGGAIESISASNVSTWLNAGIAAVLPLIINYVNSNDTRYGRGSEVDW